MMKLGMIVVTLFAFACGKDKGADKGTADKGTADKGGGGAGESAAVPAVDPNAPCPELAVTADGAALTGLTHGMGVTMVSGSYTTHMVHLFNHDKSTCEEIVSGRRNTQEGELNVRAWHGAAPGVGIDVFTQIEGTITLDKGTEKVGEPLEICVRKPITFTPNAGAYNGKKVTIVGKFTGAFCGVNKS